MTTSLYRRATMAAAAGALLGAAFPPMGWSVLLPFGVALLLAALGSPSDYPTLAVRQACYLGLAAGLVFYGITLPWLFNLFGAAAISLLFIAAAFPMLFAGLLVTITRRFTRPPAWLLSAVIWSGVEYFRSEKFWLSFGWMGLGYGPIEHGFFGAAASVVGSYGVSFIIVAIGTAMVSTPLPKPARTVYAVSLALLWLALFLVPVPVPEPNNPISVRLVQSRAGEPEEAIRLSSPPESRPVDLILWPEYSVLEDPLQDKPLWTKLQRVAFDNRSWFIFGAKELLKPGGEAYRNTAYVLDPEGSVVGKHYKNHTVHFINDGIRGTEARPIRTSLGSLGVAICFDMDYSDVARTLVQQGAEVLLVPNMDPDEWGDLQREQHRLMFQMRAAECGRWLARADVAGGTSVAGPTGREVEVIGTVQPTSMDVIVGREQGRTLYVRGGWLFGPASCLTTVLLLIATRFRRKTANSGATEYQPSH